MDLENSYEEIKIRLVGLKMYSKNLTAFEEITYLF